MFCYVQIEMTPLHKSMDEDLAEAAKEVEVRFRLSSLFFYPHYLIDEND
jgi:hypothetical protein